MFNLIIFNDKYRPISDLVRLHTPFQNPLIANITVLLDMCGFILLGKRNEFESISQALNELGFTLKVKEQDELDPPTHMSASLVEYILQLVKPRKGT